MELGQFKGYSLDDGTVMGSYDMKIKQYLKTVYYMTKGIQIYGTSISLEK